MFPPDDKGGRELEQCCGGGETLAFVATYFIGVLLFFWPPGEALAR